MDPLLLTLVLFLAAAAVWYGGRSLLRSENSGGLLRALIDDHPRLIAGVVLVAVAVLVVLGLLALLTAAG